MAELTLHPVACEFYPNDKQCYPYYEKAVALGIRVLFHTGPLPHMRMNYANPVLIDEVAADFPKLNIILTHIMDPRIEETMSIVTRRGNAYLDISCGQTLHRTEPEWISQRHEGSRSEG